jgi:methanogenic corrinoid protein MtbC1
VDSLTPFLSTDFNNLREQWESALLKELKITEVGKKDRKKQITGLEWPTLSLEASQEVELKSGPWKKASTTYVTLPEEKIKSLIQEDLQSGVRNFFFYENALNKEKWKIVEETLSSFSKKEEIEVIYLGHQQEIKSERIKVVSGLISGKSVHDLGGSAIQELAQLSHDLIKNASQCGDVVYLGVYLDSLFFQNIAKLRAARLLSQKIIQELGLNKKVEVVGLTSFSGWSVFERYSNMLRNLTSVASGYIGAADFIQSAGYNTIVELEGENILLDEHFERSLRMGRNSAHVLGLESLLGIVQDASFGSYHLESLTNSFCKNAWELMQRLQKGEDISSEVVAVREERLKLLRTRKNIMSGINDYPDVKENLNLKLKRTEFFRGARLFEELRLRMENLKRPGVYIALYGDFAALNGRINFVKNYFELLGLPVHGPDHSVLDFEEFKKNLSNRKEEIVVLCSADTSYEEISSKLPELSQKFKYIAGKFELSGYQSLYMGQDVYAVLNEIVEFFEGKKA